MPIRLPKPKRSEVLIFGAAGVTAFAPFYMMLPGAEERLAAQTLHWAPRWEKNISYFVRPAEKSIQKVSPHVERTVQHIDRRLPLDKVAQKVDQNIKKGIDKVNKQ